MDKEEKYFELLISEKEFADKQIGSALDLHVKVLGFFAAVVVLLGWIYSDKASKPVQEHVPLVMLIVVAFGCAVILQAIVFYGSSLAYTEHKRRRLQPALADLLGQKLALAGDDWRESAARRPVNIALVVLFVMHAAVSSVVLCFFWRQVSDLWLWAAYVGGAVLVVITVVCEVLMANAIKKIVFPAK